MRSELIMTLSSVGNEQLLGSFTLQVKSSKRDKTNPASDVRVYHAPLVEHWRKQKWNFISNVNTGDGIEFGTNNPCSCFSVVKKQLSRYSYFSSYSYLNIFNVCYWLFLRKRNKFGYIFYIFFIYLFLRHSENFSFLYNYVFCL